LTSARGLAWPDPLEIWKVNIGTRSVEFDVCRKEEGERRRASRKFDIDDLTNGGIKATLKEME